MRVLNVHRRRLPAPPERLAPLIDRLSSREDVLWPRLWPPMRFDRSLQVGAVGGHGPIGYAVEVYDPGRTVRFRFTRPGGFDGTHEFRLEPAGGDDALLTHTIDMRATGSGLVQWVLFLRPLHDALLEDALDRAEAFAGGAPKRRGWSLWVCFLRRWRGGKRASRRPAGRSASTGRGSDSSSSS